MNTLTPEMRSWNMSRIRRKPELTVSSVLNDMGYRFRLRNTQIPSKPDVIPPSYKAVVLVRDCFWHHLIVWKCEVKNSDILKKIIKEFFRGN